MKFYNYNNTILGSLSIDDNSDLPEAIINDGNGNPLKHKPVFNIYNDTLYVRVGIERHPMIEEHYIEWIMLVTDTKIIIHYLKPEDEPQTEFKITKEEQIKGIYVYCNIHGLWSN